MKKNTGNWRINHDIRAQELRVLDSEGKQVGVLKTGEALRKALDEGLDLVEIAPKAVPPVAKIVNFGKFKYAEDKKARKLKRKNKVSEVKEVRFSPFIAQEDYKTRLERVKEFLREGNKVRFVVVFKGRHLGSKSFGYDLGRRILTDLEAEGITITIDMEPKFLGRNLVTVISPVKGKKKEEKKNGQEQSQN